MTTDDETHDLLLTTERLRYFLTRHHPQFFRADGNPPRSLNTSFDGSSSIDDLQRLMQGVIQTGERSVRFVDPERPEFGESHWTFTKEVNGQWYEVAIARNPEQRRFNHIVHFSPIKKPS